MSISKILLFDTVLTEHYPKWKQFEKLLRRQSHMIVVDAFLKLHHPTLANFTLNL